MNSLDKAYQALGLDPGTSLELIKRRYKRLVIVWHPDRMPNDAGRREAEEELKKINNAFDLLKNHFDKQHSQSSSCDCRSESASSTGQQSSESSRHQSTSGQSQNSKRSREDEANRRERERQRQAEEARQAEANRKAEEQRRAEDAAKNATEQALKQEQAIKDEALRWKAARAAGMACALILAIGWFGITTRAAVSEMRRQWANIVQPATRPNSPSSQPADGGLPQSNVSFHNDPY